MTDVLTGQIGLLDVFRNPLVVVRVIWAKVEPHLKGVSVTFNFRKGRYPSKWTKERLTRLSSLWLS